MEDVKKYIDFSYLLSFVLFAWLGMKITDSLWRMVGRVPNPELFAGVSLSMAIGVLLALGTIAYLRLNPRIYGLATEVGVELKKTIWPGWGETKSNTMVVIAVTIIMGFVLAFYDLIWKTITDIIYP